MSWREALKQRYEVLKGPTTVVFDVISGGSGLIVRRNTAVSSPGKVVIELHKPDGENYSIYITVEDAAQVANTIDAIVGEEKQKTTWEDELT